MTDLKQHFAARGSASHLLTSRFSTRPERYDRLTVRLDVEHLQESSASLNPAAARLATGVLAGSLLIGGGQVLSALIQSGAVGKRRNGVS